MSKASIQTLTRQTLTSLVICTIALGFLFPVSAIAQNNMELYRKILQQGNHPSQKNWRRQQAEAPLIDVDAIVRRENEERMRRQGYPQQQPQRQQRGCVPSATGCGPMGIQACTCVNGQPTWVPHGHVQYNRR